MNVGDDLNLDFGRCVTCSFGGDLSLLGATETAQKITRTSLPGAAKYGSVATLAAISGLDAERGVAAGLLRRTSKARLLLLLALLIVHRLRTLILLRIRRSGNRFLRFVGYLIFVGHVIAFREKT